MVTTRERKNGDMSQRESSGSSKSIPGIELYDAVDGKMRFFFHDFVLTVLVIT